MPKNAHFNNDMRRILLCLALSLSAGALHAEPEFTWNGDSSTNFDLVISGTGEGYSGTVTSPSGLWQLQTANEIVFPSAESGKVGVGNEGTATYLGSLGPQIPPPNSSSSPPFNTLCVGTPGGYMDYFMPNAPINDGNPMNSGYLAQALFPLQDWSGISTISITSMPNPHDPSTWTWTAEYEGSGVSLAAAPEPKAISIICLAAVMGLLPRLYKKRKGARGT